MREQYFITINGTEFGFDCKSWGTRSGFAHGAKLWNETSGERLATEKVFYLNRTWECYTFQTAMLGAIRKAQNDRVTEIWKNLCMENGWERITKKRREALDNAIASDALMALLGALYSKVNSYPPGWDKTEYMPDW